MLTSSKGFSDYHVETPLVQTNFSSISLVRHKETGNLYVLKIPISHDAASRAKFRYEIEILKELHEVGYIDYLDTFTFEQKPVVVMSHHGDLTLRNLIERAPKGLSIENFVSHAIKLAKALENLHNLQFIHRDLSLDNFVASEPGLDWKLVDFNLASKWSNRTFDFDATDKMEGTLNYISPEQTGRTNRKINYLSDYYSLGALYFHLLTGTPPFSGDPLEIVHGHIAKTVPPLSSFRDDIPEVVQNIVLKLLSKDPVDRYQNIQSTIKDLTECQKRLHLGKPLNFEIAQQDHSKVFRISEKIIGRDKDIGFLLNQFTKLSNSREPKLCLVSGPSGIGKTALIKELLPAITEQSGAFASGKFEQFKKDIPYFAFSRALSKLVSYLKAEFKDELYRMRDEINQVIGKEGKLVTDLIPGMQELIGPQPGIDSKMDPASLQSRLEYILRETIYCLTRYHPVVFFIDDCQWADPASLRLMENLFIHEGDNFMIIASYRDNEVSVEHPFIQLVENIRDKFVETIDIIVTPLTKQDITDLLKLTIKHNDLYYEAMASLILYKTLGNPLFINQLLKSMYEHKVIYYSNEEQHWDIDFAKAQDLKASKNVVEMLEQEMLQLPEKDKQFIGIAAFIGSEFTLSSHTKVSSLTADAVRKVATNLVFNNYLIILGKENRLRDPDVDLSEIRLKFTHDKIQEAASKLLSPLQVESVRRKIIQMLLDQSSTDETKIFEAIDHFEKLGSRDTKEQEAYLKNLKRAYKVAKKTCAYGEAREFLSKYLSLAQEVEATDELQLLEAEYLEICFLVHDMQAVADQFYKIRDYDIPLKVLGACYEMVVQAMAELSKFEEGSQVGLEYLGKIGQPVPRVQNHITAVISTLKCLYTLKKRFHELRDKFERDQTSEHAVKLRIIGCLAPCAVNIDPSFLGHVSWVAIRDSFRQGINELTLLQCLGVSVANRVFIDQYDLNRKVVKVCEDLFALKDLDYIGVKVRVMVHNIGDSICRPVLESRNMITELASIGPKVGNYQDTSYARSTGLILDYLMGRNLEELHSEFIKYYDYVVATKNLNSIDISRLMTNRCKELLHNESFDTQRFYEIIRKKSLVSVEAFFFLTEMMNALTFGDFERGAKIAKSKRFEPALIGLLGTYHMAMLHFLRALILIWEGKGFRDKLRFKASFSYIKKHAKFYPPNHKNKELFLLAELARKQKDKGASQYYAQAAEESRKQNFVAEAAIIHERAASFAEESQLYELASWHALQARELYEAWGVSSKVEHITNLYPDIEKKVQQVLPGSIHRATSTISLNLDLLSITKSTRAISSIVEIDRLVDKLVSVAMENAGAESGSVINRVDQGFQILYLKSIRDDKVFKNTPLKSMEQSYGVSLEDLSTAWEQAHEKVLDIHPGSEIGEKVGSFLYIPIQTRGKVNMMLYLYHSSPGIFTSDRLETLRILAAQAAISCQNANLLIETRSKAKLEADLEAAKSVQETLLATQAQIPNLDIAHYYSSADQTGGDWFGYYYDEKHKICFLCCGDVTGHGVPAALVAGVACGSVEATLNRAFKQKKLYDPAQVIQEIYSLTNTSLCKNEKHAMTMSIMAISVSSGQLWHGGAGHNPPFLLDEKKTKTLLSGGSILGIDPTYNNWPIKQLLLSPGDAIVSFTDGLIENEGPDGKTLPARFFRKEMYKHRDKSSREILDYILEQGRNIWKDHPPEDDCTIVIYKWLDEC